MWIELCSFVNSVQNATRVVGIGHAHCRWYYQKWMAALKPINSELQTLP